MKKYAGYLVVAVLGGLISLGAFALIQKSGSSLKGVPQQSTPVQLTSMTGMPSTNPDFTAAANTSIHAAVSYTHLDVYKRQVPYCFLFRNPGPSQRRIAYQPQVIRCSGMSTFVHLKPFTIVVKQVKCRLRIIFIP